MNPLEVELLKVRLQWCEDMLASTHRMAKQVRPECRAYQDVMALQNEMCAEAKSLRSVLEAYEELG